MSSNEGHSGSAGMFFIIQSGPVFTTISIVINAKNMKNL